MPGGRLVHAVCRELYRAGELHLHERMLVRHVKQQQRQRQRQRGRQRGRRRQRGRKRKAEDFESTEEQDVALPCNMATKAALQGAVEAVWCSASSSSAPFLMNRVAQWVAHGIPLHNQACLTPFDYLTHYELLFE